MELNNSFSAEEISSRIRLQRSRNSEPSAVKLTKEIVRVAGLRLQSCELQRHESTQIIHLGLLVFLDHDW